MNYVCAIIGIKAIVKHNNATDMQGRTRSIMIYQWSKFSFSCVSLVESLSREIVEIRLSPSHQRAMHYSPVNNKKITCAITRTRDLWTAENRECFVNDIVYSISDVARGGARGPAPPWRNVWPPLGKFRLS